jgi:MscS family membrane protein
MKLKFETCFRWYVGLLVAVLLWSVWGQALMAAVVEAAPRATATTNTVVHPTNGVPAETPWMTFFLDQVEILQPPIMGRPIWQYLASLIYILLAFYLSKLIDFLIHNRLKKWAASTDTKVDDLLLDIIHGPVKVVTFVVLLHIGLKVFTWPQWVEDFLAKGLHLVVAISFTYMALKFTDLLMGYWQERVSKSEDRSFDEQLFPIVRKSLKVFVVLVAILVTTQNLGLNITGVLASLSIGGLALGLAAQDTLANLFGAVAIFLDKPFRIGDRIRLDAVDGTVETIGMRSTRVRNLDGHLVTIPNKTMGNATITNVSRRPTIKTEMNLGITYDTSSEKVTEALKILESVYRGHKMTHDVWISFNRFADSALNIFVVHWWNGTEQKPYLAGMQELNLEIKRQFDLAGIDFAFPTQTLHVRPNNSVRIDVGKA